MKKSSLRTALLHLLFIWGMAGSTQAGSPPPLPLPSWQEGPCVQLREPSVRDLPTGTSEKALQFWLKRVALAPCAPPEYQPLRLVQIVVWNGQDWLSEAYARDNIRFRLNGDWPACSHVQARRAKCTIISITPYPDAKYGTLWQYHAELYETY